MTMLESRRIFGKNITCLTCMHSSQADGFKCLICKKCNLFRVEYSYCDDWTPKMNKDFCQTLGGI